MNDERRDRLRRRRWPPRSWRRGNVDPAAPRVMGGEDFAYMLEERPGAFLFIGNGDSAGPAQRALRFQRRGDPGRHLLLGAAGGNRAGWVGACS